MFRSKLLLEHRSSSELARGIRLTFSTASVLSVLHGIMTETCIWDGLSNEACGRLIEVDSEVNSEVN